MRNFPLIASVVSLAFGVALGFWLEPTLFSELRIATFSTHWPEVNGTVIEARSVYVPRLGKGGYSRHLATVTFAYDVSDNKYQASQVLCECLSTTTADAELRRFAKGGKSLVFYDLLSPSLAVVRPRSFDSEFLVKWGLEIGVVLLFVVGFPVTLWVLSSNSAPHRDGREAAHLGQQSSAPARGRGR